MGAKNLKHDDADRYVLGKMIAKGGMAEIYIAKIVGAEDFYKICAIKRILPQYAQEEEFLTMFKTEADICKRLQHTNIVQVMDFTNISGSYGIVMEYVDGVDLRAILSACEQAGCRLAVPMVVYITAMIARGLHYTHVKKDDFTGKPLDLIHRDVSPQNILISFEGDVKLTDFGIAHFEAKNIETQPGVVKGKYAYMSPEQVKGLKLDFHTDVYSLAIVMWEALAMKRLFSGNTEIETIKNVQEGNIRYNLKELNSGVDQTLYDIIMKELSIDKSKRYTSAASFEQACLKYLYTYYPDFSLIELSNFLKQLLARKRAKNQELIKSLSLATTTLFPSSDKSEVSVKSDPKGEFASSKDGGNINPAPFQVINQARSSGQPVQQFAQQSQQQAVTPQLQQVFAQQQVVLKPTTPIRGVIFNKSSSNIRGISSAVRTPSMNSRYSHVRNSRPTPRNMGLPSRNKSSSFPTILFFLLIALVVGFYFVYTKTDLLPIGPSYNVQLITIPDRVKIKVNGSYLHKGNYIKTPTIIKLRGNPELVSLEKDGYMSKDISFNPKSKSATVMLSKIEQDSGIVDILVKQKHKVFVEYDNKVKRFTPVSLLNVSLNYSHNIKVFPKYPNKDVYFQCNFFLKKERLKLILDLKTKACNFAE